MVAGTERPAAGRKRRTATKRAVLVQRADAAAAAAIANAEAKMAAAGAARTAQQDVQRQLQVASGMAQDAAVAVPDLFKCEAEFNVVLYRPVACPSKSETAHTQRGFWRICLLAGGHGRTGSWSRPAAGSGRLHAGETPQTILGPLVRLWATRLQLAPAVLDTGFQPPAVLDKHCTTLQGAIFRGASEHDFGHRSTLHLLTRRPATACRSKCWTWPLQRLLAVWQKQRRQHKQHRQSPAKPQRRPCRHVRSRQPLQMLQQPSLPSQRQIQPQRPCVQPQS